MSETNSINQQISDTEKDLEAKLQVLKAEYQKNTEELNKKKQDLITLSQEYKNLLSRDVDLTITISQLEEVLETLRMKRNPSVRL
jgi:chromosome segregation ATPase